MSVDMLYVISERENLISFLPANAIGAEIGVAHGDFSQALLERAHPARLHLIDPWSHLEPCGDGDGAYLEAIAAALGPFDPPAHNELGERQYQAICERFSGRPDVSIHRQFSYKIARDFGQNYFDFIYIDGNHAFEYVLRDLHDFASTVKPDGLIMGHDFFDDAFAREQHYGVMAAVQQFLHCTNGEYRLVCLTYEPFSSFVLARPGQSGFAERFLTNLLESDIFMLEIGEDQAFCYHDKSYPRRHGTARRIPSFEKRPEPPTRDPDAAVRR
jgi:methyltransferase family protein